MNESPWLQGVYDKNNGKSLEDNPFPQESRDWFMWKQGWLDRSRDFYIPAERTHIE